MANDVLTLEWIAELKRLAADLAQCKAACDAHVDDEDGVPEKLDESYGEAQNRLLDLLVERNPRVLSAVLDLAERALQDQRPPTVAVSTPKKNGLPGQCRSAWCTQHVPNGFLYCAACASVPHQVSPSMDSDPIPHVLGGES